MIEYRIKAHPTTYKDRRYRSRLEAKWAAFFDLIGWPFEYEPADLGGWSPDFCLMTFGEPLYVEIKPISGPDPDVVEKLSSHARRSLLLGISPVGVQADIGVKFGWIVDRPADDLKGTPLDFPIVYNARMCSLKSGRVGLLTDLDEKELFSGVYDPTQCQYDCNRPSPELLMKAWSIACNEVQWRPA